MSGSSEAERAAMRRALAIAATPGVPLGPNPRVGCVLIDAAGTPVAEGFHRGAGTPHAEVAALLALDRSAAGLTAVVTLEPCDHTGRTGPCSRALLEAGITRVVVATPDPTDEAAGGAETLRAAGVDVVVGLMADDAVRLNRHWLHGLEHRRPFVTWKFASSLDGRSSAMDGSSRWVSNSASRADTHRRRAEADVMMVGTGTVLADDPWLTVRAPGDPGDPLPHQPLRVVVGQRPVPPTARVLDDAAGTWVTGHRDLAGVLADLYAGGRRHVFLEGGPTLAGAALTAGLVDEVVGYVAPMLLGGGTEAVRGLTVPSIDAAVRFDVLDLAPMGEAPDVDVRLVLRPRAASTAAPIVKES